MSTSINLLPWREELREERKKSFTITLVVVIALAGLILLGIDQYFRGAIANQIDRNNYLSEQIAVLDRQLVEIREIRRQKDVLAARMQVIQDLQGSRPVIVRLFDQLVRNLPDGVFYEQVARTGDSISLTGIANSNYTISSLMEELKSSEWFDNPVLGTLTTLNSGSDGSEARIRFSLTIKITRPDQTQAQDQAQ